MWYKLSAATGTKPNARDWLRACHGERAPRRLSLMRIKQRDVYTTRYYRHGNSMGVVIPPDIREMMELNPGDTLAMNFSHGVLWAVKITKDVIITREKVAAVFDKLFPDKEQLRASKRNSGGSSGE